MTRVRGGGSSRYSSGRTSPLSPSSSPRPGEPEFGVEWAPRAEPESGVAAESGVERDRWPASEPRLGAGVGAVLAGELFAGELFAWERGPLPAVRPRGRSGREPGPPGAAVSFRREGRAEPSSPRDLGSRGPDSRGADSRGADSRGAGGVGSGEVDADADGLRENHPGRPEEAAGSGAKRGRGERVASGSWFSSGPGLTG